MKKEDWNKISKDYYGEILSPIKDSKENLLVGDLSLVEDSNSKSVIDIGCGIGEIERFLSEKFKEVYAIDFSEGMIKKAFDKNKNLDNVSFEVMDMVDLGKLDRKFDVALSVNSIIMPEIDKVDLVLKNIHSLLNKNGKFFCVLPSMEVYAYESLLIAEKELKKDRSYDKIEEKVKDSIPEDEHDFHLGMTNFQGKQKNYYRFEILWRFKKAGFRNIQIKKIFYPWKVFKEAGQMSFPKEDLPWDWYVICEK